MTEGSSKSIWIACPACKSRTRFSAANQGKPLRCSQCSTPLTPPAEIDLPVSDSTEEISLAAASVPSSITLDDDEIRIAPEPPAPPIWTVATQGQVKASTSDAPPVAKKTLPRKSAPDEGNPRAAVSERPAERLKKARSEKSQAEDDDKPSMPDSWVEPPEDASLAWTFFSNTFAFSFHRNAMPQWLAITLGFLISAFIGQYGKTAFEMGGIYGLVSGSLLGIASIAILMFSGSYAMACMIDIVTNTAYNLDKADDWPDPDWRERLWQFWRVIYLFGLSAIAGWGVSTLLGPSPEYQLIPFSITVFLLFPVMLLSALESTSFLLPFSTSVWRSMLVAPAGWLVFYGVAGGTIAIWLALNIFLVSRLGGWAFWIVCPMEATMIFTYGRFIGRLACYIMKRTGTRTIEQERIR